MKKWKTIFSCDYYRYYEKEYKLFSYFRMPSQLKIIYWFRIYQNTKGFRKKIAQIVLYLKKKKNNNDIDKNASIGFGLYLSHSGGRYISEDSVIGNNVSIYQNVTIGAEFRGLRKGSPVIGNKVFIGPNSTIVGKISIGDDVLIAPNTFVNFSVPPHSIVIGNPAVIKRVENATGDGYLRPILKENE